MINIVQHLVYIHLFLFWGDIASTIINCYYAHKCDEMTVIISLDDHFPTYGLVYRDLSNHMPVRIYFDKQLS